MQPISQVYVGYMSQVKTHHITFPRALISSCSQGSNRVFVFVLFAPFECLQSCFCSFAFFMRTVDKMSVDIMLFGLSPVHLDQHLCLLPDPGNWCFSLVSKWLTNPEIESVLNL